MPFSFASFLFLIFFGLVLLDGVIAHPSEGPQIIKISGALANVVSIAPDPSPGCFPELGFEMPSSVPSSLEDWWCSTDSEYGFVGFSYEVTSCEGRWSLFLSRVEVLTSSKSGQSAEKLKEEFQDIRQTFNGRYVRLYGACDRVGF